MSTIKLQGKIALITGGGSGIGAATTKRLVAEGAKVCIAGLVAEELEAVASELPAGSVATCRADLFHHEDIERIVEKTLSFGSGKIDVLINCAAFVRPGDINTGGSMVETSLENWRNSFDINVTAPFLLMKAFIPYMQKAGGGSIINISSLAGVRSTPQNVAYAASKAALVMLTRQAAQDYGPFNIRCNIICPGPIKTAMFQKHYNRMKEIKGGADKVFINVPLRRAAEPSEVAGVCAFLAGDDSSFMTGAILMVDGGIHILDASSI